MKRRESSDEALDFFFDSTLSHLLILLQKIQNYSTAKNDKNIILTYFIWL